MGIREVNSNIKLFGQKTDIAGVGKKQDGMAVDSLQKSKKLFAAIDETSVEIKLKNYNNAGEAVADIINESNPDVIAFGEQHCNTREKNGFKSTPALFAEQIVPVLGKYCGDIVLEFLPSKGDSDIDVVVYNSLQLEIDKCFESNDKNVNAPEFNEKYPTLYLILSKLYDPQGTLEIILAAKSNGIKIHGGGLTFTQVVDVIENMNNKEPEKTLNYMKIVNENLYKTIKDLLKEGKKIAVYGGALHNDIKGKYPDLIFGDELKSEGIRYKAVDLIVPEIVKNDTIVYRDMLYAKIAPNKGVLRNSESGDEEVIIFPKSETSIADINPHIRIYIGIKSKEVRDVIIKFVNEFTKKFNINVDGINPFKNGFMANSTISGNEKEFILNLYNVCNVDDTQMQDFIKEFAKNNKGFNIYLDKINVRGKKESIVEKSYDLRICFDHELKEDYVPTEAEEAADKERRERFRMKMKEIKFEKTDDKIII